MAIQIPGLVELFFVGTVVLLFLVVTLAVFGGFLALRRDRSPADERLDRLENHVQELQRRVDDLESSRRDGPSGSTQNPSANGE